MVPTGRTPLFAVEVKTRECAVSAALHYIEERGAMSHWYQVTPRREGRLPFTKLSELG